MQNKRKPLLVEPLFLKINKHIKQDLRQGPTIFSKISIGSLRHSLISVLFFITFFGYSFIILCVFLAFFDLCVFLHNSSLFFYFTSDIFLLDFAGVNLTKWAIEYEDPTDESFKFLSMGLKMPRDLSMA